MTNWWLDESEHAGAEHLDPAYVQGYDAKAQVDPTEDVQALVALGMDAASVVVDLGAGTGTFALAAAATTGAQVTAVDVSPAMVRVIQQRADTDGVPVTAVCAGFLSYDHEGPPVDVVYSRNALHQLPDFWKVMALERLAATMRPGAILFLRDLVFDMEAADVPETMEAWMAFASTDPARGYTAEDFANHVRDEHSTFTWLLEPMLDHAGFDITKRDIRMNTYATYMCVRRA